MGSSWLAPFLRTGGCRELSAARARRSAHRERAPAPEEHRPKARHARATPAHDAACRAAPGLIVSWSENRRGASGRSVGRAEGGGAGTAGVAIRPGTDKAGAASVSIRSGADEVVATGESIRPGADNAASDVSENSTVGAGCAWAERDGTARIRVRTSSRGETMCQHEPRSRRFVWCDAAASTLIDVGRSQMRNQRVDAAQMHPPVGHGGEDRGSFRAFRATSMRLRSNILGHAELTDAELEHGRETGGKMRACANRFRSAARAASAVFTQSR
mgnify:CR=1 FL=1